MPLYEYRCTKCHELLEVLQGFSDKPLTKCESCGGRLEKLISRSGFVLKGGGWYKSDYTSPAKEARRDDAEPAPASTGKDATAGAKASTEGAADATAKPAAGSEAVKTTDAPGGGRMTA